MHSALISALLWTRVAPQLVLNAPTPMITPGPSGLTSAPATKSTPFWHLSQTQSHTYKSLHNDIATAALPKMVSQADLDLRAIGQTMASLGSEDRRLVAPKTLDYRLSQQLAG
jgi:hypothetical protein